jgi:signal transduction histidine kinase
MKSLVDQMLNLGKPTKRQLEEIDLAFELDRILGTLGTLGVVKYCRIEKDFDAALPTVYGDPAQIEQVFRNLIVNAAQAMEKSSRKEMKVSLRPCEKDLVEAVVYDTGDGIAEEHMDQIFQPFFTTKSESKGTGLGLPIVKTIVDRHNGAIDVTSEVGRGTRFAVRLPAHTLAGRV